MKLYCKFLHNVYDQGELIWEKGKEYQVSHEEEHDYYFNDPIELGVSKNFLKRYFILVEKD